jgi:hypothetical protein
MELAGNVLGNVIESLGPSHFAEALRNTTRDGALYDAKGVDMDNNDEDAQDIWLQQIERLRQVGLWLEGERDIPDFAKSAVEKVSRSDQRSLSELKVDDHSIQQIVVIESLVFEATGFKIQILRKSSSKKTIVLRGSLLWFAGAMINLAEDDNDLLDVLAFTARCIPEQGVKVCFDEHEYACAPDYDRVKYRKLEQEKEQPDSFEPCYETTVLEFERFVRNETGCHIRLDQSDDDEVLTIMGVTREFIERNLENMVRQDRKVEYLIAYLRDTLNLPVTTNCNMRHVLMGDAGMPVVSIAAKRRLVKSNTEALS